MPTPLPVEAALLSSEEREREKRMWWTIRIPVKRGVQAYRCPSQEVALRLLAVFADATGVPGAAGDT